MQRNVREAIQRAFASITNSSNIPFCDAMKVFMKTIQDHGIDFHLSYPINKYSKDMAYKEICTFMQTFNHENIVRYDQEYIDDDEDTMSSDDLSDEEDFNDFIDDYDQPPRLDSDEEYVIDDDDYYDEEEYDSH